MLAKQRLSLFLTFRENEWWRWRDTPRKHGDYDIDWDGKIDAMPGMHPVFKNGFWEHYRIRPTESRASTMGFLDLLSPFPWVFDTGQSCLWKWTVQVFPASAFLRNSQNCMLRHRWRSFLPLPFRGILKIVCYVIGGGLSCLCLFAEFSKLYVTS